MKHIYIVGAGGLGRELLSLMKSDVAFGLHWVVVGFIDSREELKGTEIDGIPVVGGTQDVVISSSTQFAVAVGDVHIKKQIVDELLARNAVFIAIQTQCRVGERSTNGASVFQLDVFVSVDCQIQDYVYLDSNVVIGHDCYVGSYSHIGSGVFIGGRTKIGECVNIHSRAVIAQDITIGEGAVIGLGAVVLKNVPPGATVLGNPARQI
jgi:sugar O-acyltransferase (sialic acid O-acetyltransferase NeuD family)